MKTSGLDVHKDSIFCAIYDGKSYSGVKEFTTTTVSIRSLGQYLRSEKVKRVAMESTSIRLSSCISYIDSKSFMQIVEALIRGETDPEALVRLVYANRENKKSGKLGECLTRQMKAHHRLKLTTCKQQFDLIEQQIALYLSEMQKLCDTHFKEDIDNLTTLPGVSLISAMIIIAETGGDMSAFETSGKFTGWTGLRPRNDESAGKEKIKEKGAGSHWKKNVSDHLACFKRKNAVQSKSCSYLRPCKSGTQDKISRKRD
ncbi:hypothetical protein AGMMS50262_04990 [Bacteroidia bacterium]|nr:hypothetical protein AGMMS50262_04990 [Bacteroidia bacterium]